MFRIIFCVILALTLAPSVATAHLLPPGAAACLGPAGLVNRHCFPGHVIPPKPPAAAKQPALIQSNASNTTMKNYVGPYVTAAAFCGATNLWVQAEIKNVTVNQQLTFREAHKAVWNCFIPFIGGWMVDRAFDANPQWPHR